MFKYENSKKTGFLILLLWGCFALAEGDPKTTEAYWQQQIGLEPSKALNYFNLGVLSQQHGQYNEAIKNYDKAIRLQSPLAPVALYYKARAYESLGNVSEAQRILSTIQLEQIPANLKSKVLEYKNRLFAASVGTEIGSASTHEQEAVSSAAGDEKALSVYFEAARGTNSNPDIYADTQSSSIQSDSQTQLRAGLGYLLWASSVHDLKINYYYSSTQFDKATGSNYSSHDVLLPVSFYFGSSRLKLTPEYTQDTYSGETFSESRGSELTYTLKLDDDYLNLSYQNMKIDNKTANYSYLTGSLQKLQLAYESRWTHSKLVSSAGVSNYRYEDTSTLASSYTAYAGSLNYTWYSGNFDLGGILSLEARQYKKASGVALTRSDFKYAVNAQAGYTFTHNFRLFLDANYARNQSTFNTTADDRNYQQSTFALGLNWGLLAALTLIFFVGCTHQPEAPAEPEKKEIKLAFVGDVILHERLRKREEKTHEGFEKIWEGLNLASADLTYANLEGPVAPQVGGVSGYPMFNYPASIIPALKNSGFDVVSTANNHALDRSSRGIEATIINLRKSGLNYTGTRILPEESWFTVIETKDFKVAFLACTEMVNGNFDKKKQVLYCYKNEPEIQLLVKELKLKYPAVIVIPHWGEENTFKITDRKRSWARARIDDGATAVVGSHPHVIQTLEKYGSGVIAYSLGNFVSNQSEVQNRLSMALYLKFTGNALTAIQARPLWMTRSVDKDWTSKYRLIDAGDFLNLPARAKKIWGE